KHRAGQRSVRERVRPAVLGNPLREGNRLVVVIDPIAAKGGNLAAALACQKQKLHNLAARKVLQNCAAIHRSQLNIRKYPSPARCARGRVHQREGRSLNKTALPTPSEKSSNGYEGMASRGRS